MPNQDEIMPFNFKTENNTEKCIIKVIGVGGGGGNAVNNMIKEGIENVDFIICNTDEQVLEVSKVKTKIQLGFNLTAGLGAGNDPTQGENAAKESIQEITQILQNKTKMVFIAAGMGGGTGTGAAPIIAKVARELKILTVGIVTIPFVFEGKRRIAQAINGLNELAEHLDAMIVINNQKLIEVHGKLSMTEAFKKADEIITIAVKGIAEIITKPGTVNVDFADVKSVMKDSGVAVMGTGFSEGEKRAIKAVKNAINSPLLNNNDIKGAKNLLVNIMSPAENEISTEEITEINDFLQNQAGFRANLIWGMSIDENLEKDKTSVTVVATNFDDNIIPTELNLFPNEIENEKDDNENNNSNDYKNKKTYEQIKAAIQQIENKKIEYFNETVVDNVEKNPAFKRHNIQINLDNNNGNNGRFNLGKNNNDFINPMID